MEGLGKHHSDDLPKKKPEKEEQGSGFRLDKSNAKTGKIWDKYIKDMLEKQKQEKKDKESQKNNEEK